MHHSTPRLFPVSTALSGAVLAFTMLVQGQSRVGTTATRLTPTTYEAVKTQINVASQELDWQKVAWRNGFFTGLLEAQAKDKPLFYWIYEGDPRGGC